MSDNPRFRISAKQTAKNYWQLDGTVEWQDDEIVKSVDKSDLGNVVSSPLGARLLTLIKETESAFRSDGRVIIGDVS